MSAPNEVALLKDFVRMDKPHGYPLVYMGSKGGGTMHDDRATPLPIFQAFTKKYHERFPHSGSNGAGSKSRYYAPFRDTWLLQALREIKAEADGVPVDQVEVSYMYKKEKLANGTSQPRRVKGWQILTKGNRRYRYSAVVPEDPRRRLLPRQDYHEDEDEDEEEEEDEEDKEYEEEYEEEEDEEDEDEEEGEEDDEEADQTVDEDEEADQTVDEDEEEADQTADEDEAADQTADEYDVVNAEQGDEMGDECVCRVEAVEVAEKETPHIPYPAVNIDRTGLLKSVLSDVYKEFEYDTGDFADYMKDITDKTTTRVDDMVRTYESAQKGVVDALNTMLSSAMEGDLESVEHEIPALLRTFEARSNSEIKRRRVA